MNFSSYEELYDVFKNTAVFYNVTSTKGRIYIPQIEANSINVSYGDNLTIAIINQVFEDGYVKFNGSIIQNNAVTVPQNISSNTNRDKKLRQKFSGLFVCKKGENATIPLYLSTYYNMYLLNRGLIFKARLRKQVKPSKYDYIYYQTTIPNRHTEVFRYSYADSIYNCYYINLEDEKSGIRETKVKPSYNGNNSYLFTLPREKTLNSRFSEGDVIQVIAQRAKEIFGFPERAK